MDRESLASTYQKAVMTQLGWLFIDVQHVPDTVGARDKTKPTSRAELASS